MTKLTGYARVSTKQQSTDRQQADLLAAGIRRDDPVCSSSSVGLCQGRKLTKSFGKTGYPGS